MSKYEPLWRYIAEKQPEIITFDEAESICGFQIDHAFLTFKNELEAYGFKIGKISMKARTVKVEKVLP